MPLNDLECEKAVLSGFINYGFESYHDLTNIGLTENSFYSPTNKILFKCLKHCFEIDNVKNIDVPLLVNSAKNLGYESWINSETTKEEINDIHEIEVTATNLYSLAKKIKTLEVANKIIDSSKEIQKELKDITGQEKISDIFGIAEKKLSNVSEFLTESSEDPIDIGNKVKEHIKDLSLEVVDQLGIPTGFPIFDKCIGGGLRKHAITVIAARAKVGKSTLCKNMAFNIAKSGIPVLYLDTEMESEDQINRLVASASDVSIDDIETGKFTNSPIHKQNIRRAINDIENISFKHKNIAGLNLESQMSIIRKWIIRHVGLDKFGKAKDCVLVYDYIKLMSGSEMGNMQEYQAIGFLMTTLQNLAVKYDIPILTAAQLNRDGISVEDTSAIGGSDRISMYGSSVSILKWKTVEELESENYQWGNQKLIPLISRYGPAMDPGDFINLTFKTTTNAMLEKGTRANSQNSSPKTSNKSSTTKKESKDLDIDQNYEF